MVKTVALVNDEGGKVENLIVYDDANPIPAPAGQTMVDAPDGLQVGDWYLDGAFIPNAIRVAAAPGSPAVGEIVTVMATLPQNTRDTEVAFQVEGGHAYTEPVAGGQASHSYAFASPGIYRVAVSSASHGSQTMEVTVQ